MHLDIDIDNINALKSDRIDTRNHDNPTSIIIQAGLSSPSYNRMQGSGLFFAGYRSGVASSSRMYLPSSRNSSLRREVFRQTRAI